MLATTDSIKYNDAFAAERKQPRPLKSYIMITIERSYFRNPKRFKGELNAKIISITDYITFVKTTICRSIV
jgi:hypothetical protein